LPILIVLYTFPSPSGGVTCEVVHTLFDNPGNTQEKVPYSLLKVVDEHMKGIVCEPKFILVAAEKGIVVPVAAYNVTFAVCPLKLFDDMNSIMVGYIQSIQNQFEQDENNPIVFGNATMINKKQDNVHFGWSVSVNVTLPVDSTLCCNMFEDGV
jgi:hypothetical protein